MAYSAEVGPATWADIPRCLVSEKLFVRVGEGTDAKTLEHDVEDKIYGDGGNDQAAKSNELGETPRAAEYRAWWSPVLEMTFDDPDQEPGRLYWPNNVRFPLPWPGAWIVAVSFENRVIGVGTSGRTGADQALLDRLEPHRNHILDALPVGSEFKRKTKGEGHYYGIERAVTEFADDDAQRRWLMEMINQYINVFRPMIDRLMRDDQAQTAG